MLARVRLSVPDRPGSLGSVTSAIGAVGADIVEIDVLESESGRALDDVFVKVRDRAHLAVVTDRLAGLVGVQVVGSQHPAPPVTGHADLELLHNMLRTPQRALQTFADGAPHAFGADWAAVVEYTAGEFYGTVAMSTRAPAADQITLSVPLRLAPLRLPGPAGEPAAGAALVPIGEGPLGLLLVRQEGPDFHPYELWRVDQVGRIVGTVLAPV